MRLGRNTLLLLATLLACGPGASAQELTSNEGALFLLLPIGARGVSLARAMTGVPGPEGAFWNPAGLAGVDRSQAVVVRGEYLVGTATALSTLWSRPGLGTMGLSYYLLDAGEIGRRDDVGNPTGTTTYRNHLGIVSGATQLFEALSAGMNFKVVRYQESCRGICRPDEGVTATTYAIDAGIQVGIDRMRFAAMVAHVGPRLQVKNAEQADPLPSRVRVAAAYNVLNAFVDIEDLSGWLAVELEDKLREPGFVSVYVGGEVTAGQGDVLSLRAGYAQSQLEAETGPRVGLGLTYERFDLSLAKSLIDSPATGEPEPIYVTFSIRF